MDYEIHPPEVFIGKAGTRSHYVGRRCARLHLHNVAIPGYRFAELEVIGFSMLTKDPNAHPTSVTENQGNEGLEVLPVQFLDRLSQPRGKGCTLGTDCAGEGASGSLQRPAEEIGMSNAARSAPKALKLGNLAGQVVRHKESAVLGPVAPRLSGAAELGDRILFDLA